MNRRRIAAAVLMLAVIGQSKWVVGDDEDPFADARIEAARARADERSVLEEQRSQLDLQLQELQETRAWAVEDFVDVTSTEAISGKLSEISARAALVQGIMIERYTDQPSDELLGQIHSGRALNNLFAVLRPTAVEHERHLAYLSELPQETITAIDQERLEILDEIDRSVEINPQLLTDLQCQYIGAGAPLTMKLSALDESPIDPLPLVWPVFFDRDPSFGRFVQAVELARERFLEDLQDGDVEAESRRDLMIAIDRLQEHFQAKYRAALRSNLEAAQIDFRNGNFDPLTGARSTHTTQQLVDGSSFMRTLRCGAGRLLETEYIEVAPLQSRRADGRYTLIQLLAYMQENGLRFSVATVSSEPAQLVIYESMVRYYRQMVSLQMAVDFEESRITQKEKELVDHIDRLYEMEERLLNADEEPENPFFFFTTIFGQLQ